MSGELFQILKFTVLQLSDKFVLDKQSLAFGGMIFLTSKRMFQYYDSLGYILKVNYQCTRVASLRRMSIYQRYAKNATVLTICLQA